VISKILLVRQRLANVLGCSRREIQVLVLTACYAALVACGGGGGGGGDGGGNNPTGSLEAHVTDEFDSPVSGARVEATVGGTARSGTTDASGVVTVGNIPVGNADVEVSLATFQSATTTANITDGGTARVDVELFRSRQAAGGVLTTSVVPGTISADGSSMTVRVRVVVVDDNSDAIENLTPADFALNDCTPSATVDCVRLDGSGSTAGYTVTDTTPDCAPGSSATCTVAGQPLTAQAAALMLDQSGSVGNNSDPTGARLFSAKEFLRTVTTSGDDFVLVSAFAADRTNPAQTALIPEQPLTVYNNGTFTKDGPSFDSDLDDLASQAGGGTPLYRSLFPEDTDSAHNQDPTFVTGMIDIVADAPEVSALPKSIVLFTDGEDEECGGSAADRCPDKRDRVIQHALDRNVRIFTIGLSNEVDFQALGELSSQTGGVGLFAETAEQLIPLYGSLGALLSDSLLTYDLEWTISSDPGTFATGNSVLGRVQVSAAGATIQVPFIVGIP